MTREPKKVFSGRCLLYHAEDLNVFEVHKRTASCLLISLVLNRRHLEHRHSTSKQTSNVHIAINKCKNLAFYLSPAVSTSSFSFGTGPPTSGTAPFSFGTTNTAPQPGGFQIGTSNPPTFGFGTATQATPAFSFSSAPLNTGTATTSTAGAPFGFGTPSVAGSFGTGIM